MRGVLKSVATHARGLLAARFPSEPPVGPERLRAGLDGRAVTVSGRDWRIQVYSVCDWAGRRWVQLALDGDPHYMLTLNLAAGAGVQRALIALALCLANPGHPAGIVNVA